MKGSTRLDAAGLGLRLLHTLAHPAHSFVSVQGRSVASVSSWMPIVGGPTGSLLLLAPWRIAHGARPSWTGRASGTSIGSSALVDTQPDELRWWAVDHVLGRRHRRSSHHPGRTPHASTAGITALKHAARPIAPAFVPGLPEGPYDRPATGPGAGSPSPQLVLGRSSIPQSDALDGAATGCHWPTLRLDAAPANGVPCGADASDLRRGPPLPTGNSTRTPGSFGFLPNVNGTRSCERFAVTPCDRTNDPTVIAGSGHEVHRGAACHGMTMGSHGGGQRTSAWWT